jgi:hypothetical protein
MKRDQTVCLLRLAAVLLVAIVASAVTMVVRRERFYEAPVAEGALSASRPPPPTADYLHKRSSCFSCEHAFPEGEEWRGQPSKCFSCERQMAADGDPFRASRTWHA